MADELFADDTFILLTKDKGLKEKTEEQISESGGAVARSITKRVCMASLRHHLLFITSSASSSLVENNFLFLFSFPPSTSSLPITSPPPPSLRHQ